LLRFPSGFFTAATHIQAGGEQEEKGGIYSFHRWGKKVVSHNL
jgi:hypothetical protein